MLICANFLLSLPSLRIPCLVEFSPSSGWPNAKRDEQCGLRLGGSWKVCMKLVVIY
jgi:hypothetical protein